MNAEDLSLIAHRLLQLPPDLLGQQEIAFLCCRTDRHDWIAADEPVILHLARRLLQDHPR